MVGGVLERGDTVIVFLINYGALRLFWSYSVLCFPFSPLIIGII
ncbi:hypothetical protein NTHI1209_01289 [Haemophilus influenzae]|uniref:Uncharacterized protein n=1 Tax=Haemophilus influenzae TaxID=727 RepID=A0A158SXT7_HAEIF|nr:hypothetical protein NTHI1209_01289 [Haemophilus influenzae]